MKVFIGFILIGLCLSCGRKATSTSSSTPEMAKENVISNIDSFCIVNIPAIPAGVKYQPKRDIDPQSPPVVLDYTQELPETPLEEIGDYFESVTGVMIEHPEKDQRFFSDCRLSITRPNSIFSYNTYNSSIWISDQYIIAGDEMVGIYIYDCTGKLYDTIPVDKWKYEYNPTSRQITVQAADRHSNGYMGGLNLQGNRCSYNVIDTTRQYKTVWYNLDLKQNYQEAAMVKGGRRCLPDALDETHYFTFTTDLYGRSKNFLRVFGLRGDTLCEFPNYIRPTEKIEGSHANPDRAFLYQLGGVQHVRQAYSDTIFQLLDYHRLVPAYLLNFGEKRTDITTGLLDDKAGKLIPSQWIETPKVVFFSYTENYDCRNTRERGEVKYFYSYYDKTKKKLSHLPVGQLYPDELLLTLPLKESLPFTWDMMSWKGDKLVIVYTRIMLENMMKLKKFKELPVQRQKQVKDLWAKMNDRQMYIMMVE